MKDCNFILRQTNHEDEHIYALIVETHRNFDDGFYFTVSGLSFEGHICFIESFSNIDEPFLYVDQVCERYPEFDDERSCGIDNYKDWPIFKEEDFE